MATPIHEALHVSVSPAVKVPVPVIEDAPVMKVVTVRVPSRMSERRFAWRPATVAVTPLGTCTSPLRQTHSPVPGVRLAVQLVLSAQESVAVPFHVLVQSGVT